MRQRRATTADANAIAQVHVASWRSAYAQLLPHEYLSSLSVAERAEMWARAAATGSPAVVVAEVEDQVVGFIAYGSPREPGNPPGSAEVRAIYVHPDSWRMGIGQSLLCAALGDLAQQGFKSAYLWALVGNDRASVFYQQFGFILDQGARKYFELAGVQSGEDKFAIDLLKNAA